MAANQLLENHLLFENFFKTCLSKWFMRFCWLTTNPCSVWRKCWGWCVATTTPNICCISVTYRHTQRKGHLDYRLSFMVVGNNYQNANKHTWQEQNDTCAWVEINMSPHLTPLLMCICFAFLNGAVLLLRGWQVLSFLMATLFTSCATKYKRGENFGSKAEKGWLETLRRTL